MKLKQKKIVFSAIFLTLALVLCGTFYVIHKDHKATQATTAIRQLPHVDYTPATTADNQTSEQKKSAPPASSSTTTAPTSGTAASPVTVTLTRAGVRDDNLEVATLIQGATAGSCTLTVTQSGQSTISSTENIILQNNSFVCPVFALPLSRFPNRQPWNVAVTVTTNATSTTANWQANPVSLGP